MTPDAQHPAPFDVHVHNSGSTCVLTVRGDLDLATSPHLGSAVDTAVAEGATTIVIDLTGVTFLSSTGMTVLVDATVAVSSPQRLAVVASGPITRRPMMLVGLDQHLSVYPTRATALAATL